MEILVLFPYHKTLSFLGKTEVAIGTADQKGDYSVLNSLSTESHTGFDYAVIAFLSNGTHFRSL